MSPLKETGSLHGRCENAPSPKAVCSMSKTKRSMVVEGVRYDVALSDGSIT